MALARIAVEARDVLVRRARIKANPEALPGLWRSSRPVPLPRCRQGRPRSHSLLRALPRRAQSSPCPSARGRLSSPPRSVRLLDCGLPRAAKRRTTRVDVTAQRDFRGNLRFVVLPSRAACCMSFTSCRNHTTRVAPGGRPRPTRRPLARDEWLWRRGRRGPQRADFARWGGRGVGRPGDRTRPVISQHRLIN